MTEARFEFRPNFIDFGTIVKGSVVTREFTIIHLSGDIAGLNFDIETHPWATISATGPFPTTVKVTVDTGKLTPGAHTAPVFFLAGSKRLRLPMTILVEEPKPVTPPPPTPAAAASLEVVANPGIWKGSLASLVVITVIVTALIMLLIFTPILRPKFAKESPTLVPTITPQFSETVEANNGVVAFSVVEGQDLKFDGLSRPQWSHDGLFIAWEDTHRIVVTASDLTKFWEIPTEIGRSTQGIRWSPITDSIAYVRESEVPNNSGIWLVEIDGATRAIWHSGDIDFSVDPIDFDWSPDGTKIVFTFKNDLYLINVNGTNLTQVDLVVPARKPIWSQTGNFIAFESDVDDSGDQKPIVVVVNADGSHPQIVKDATDTPRWIGDSDKLMAHMTGGAKTIIVESPFTSRNATNFDSRTTLFAPDGLSYLSYIGGKLMLSTSTTPISTTLKNEHVWSADWSPNGSKFALSIGEHAYLYDSNGNLIKEITKK